MLRIIYSSLFTAALPFLLLRLWFRGRKSPAYRERIGERFFLKQKPTKPVIWVHSVSLGETIASRPLVEHLLNNYPNCQVLVTCMTPTGSAQALKLYGEKVLHQYLPYDIPLLIRPFIKKLKPKLLIIFETELWPNLIFASQSVGCKLMLTNARLSEKSAKGYERLSELTKPVLNAFDLIAVQNPVDAKRFTELGCEHAKVKVTGSIKYETQLDVHQIQQAEVIKPDDRFVVIAASTHEGEDEILLSAFRKLQNKIPELNPLLILVPRHPERFLEVKRLVNQQNFNMVSRTENFNLSQKVEVILGDTMGEMSFYFGLCDAAFVGGSLINSGGHNPLEPASIGKPVLMGPHVFNFQYICDEMLEKGLLWQIQNEEQLAAELAQLALDPVPGELWIEFVENQKGAVKLQCDMIDSLLIKRASNEERPKN